MPAFSRGDLKAMLAAAKADAMSAMAASKLSEERAKALDYYLGDMSADMPAPDGRSQAVSTDVADTVEGLMPTLMDIFCGGDEVVRFEPVGPEDVPAAEQETDYVNHVFMQQNPGFLVLYSFIKDALLSKVGIVKVWWETQGGARARDLSISTSRARSSFADRSSVRSRSRRGRSQPSREHERGSARRHRARRKRTYQCARVEGVPPEEFGIARNARSIRDADYCFHDVLQVGGQADRAGLRPRAGQAACRPTASTRHDRGAGPRYRRRGPEAGR